MVIETDFPKAARARLARHGGLDVARGAGRIVGVLTRGVRMDADRKPYVRPSRADFIRLPQLRIIVSGQNDHGAREARLARTRDDIVEVVRELRSGEVAMG